MIAMDRDREQINDLVKVYMTIRYPGGRSDHILHDKIASGFWLSFARHV